MIKYVLMVVCLLAFTACGGGGSSSEPQATPTPTTKIFDLSKIQSTAIGTFYSTQLTGSDSNGVNYSGSFSMANRAQSMLDGVLVTPHDLIISLTGGGDSFTVTATSNVDTSGNLISIVIQTTGLVCTPVSPDSMPTTVKIGDFGIRSTLVCNDDTTSEGSWRIEDGGNGAIKFISNATVKDQFNTVVSVADVTYTINSDGDIVSFKTVSTVPESNYTLTYQST